MSWIDDLKKGFKGDVSTDEETLEANSRDASAFKVMPKVVVFPKDEDDIKYLINFVNKNKNLSLTARAAGTDMTGGPLTESIVVSFTKYLNNIKHLDQLTATVQPGLYYRDLEKEMDKIDVMFGSYPASKAICALGGIIANNAGGEKCLTYGQTVDHVLRLKVALADGNIYEFKKLNLGELKKKLAQKDFEGEIYRKMYDLCEKNYDIIKQAQPKVSKNATGYFLWKVWDKKNFDLTKLFVGSQGTLGLWTEADIELVRKYKHSRLVIIHLDDLKNITPMINVVKKYKPESLESYDKHTLILGLKFMPDIAKKVHQNLFSFLWEFRKEAGTFVHGLPLLTVIAELTGDNELELQEKAHKLGKELEDAKMHNLVMESEKDGQKYWALRRESFNLLRQKVKGKMAVPFVDDFGVKPEYLSEFLPKLYKLLEDNKINPTLAGHVGDGNFHIIPLMDLNKKEEREKLTPVLQKFSKLVEEYKGTMSAEHNDGLIRAEYVEKQFGKKIYSLFRETKKIFDPKGVFNPGKKIDVNPEFIRSHVKGK